MAHIITVLGLIAENEDELIKKSRVQDSLDTIIVTYRVASVETGNEGTGIRQSQHSNKGYQKENSRIS